MIFVDTGAWIAQLSKRDQYHDLGIEIFARLHHARTPLATSTPVLYETITFLTREIGPNTAITVGKQLMAWKSLRMLRPDASDELQALTIMEKYAGHPVGFVDCLSFALMRRYRIATAFTFDRHFEAAGFSVSN